MRVSVSDYRIFLENLSAAVVAHAPDTTILYCNKKAQELLGLSIDEIQGKTSIDPQWRFIREDGTDLPIDEFPISIVIRSGIALTDYVIGIIGTAMPNVSWVSCNSSSIYNSDGTLDHVLISCVDITKYKVSRSALLESETKLRTLIDTIPDLVWLQDEDGIYLSCNRAFERLYGVSQEEIVGKTDYDFVDKNLADFFREHDRKAMAAGRPTVNEEALSFAEDGYSGLFETIKTPMLDKAGNLLGVLGIARDISDRKNNEIALKENEQRYKNAERMGNVGNWEYDILSGKVWGSEQAIRIFGFDPDIDQFALDQVENCIFEPERVHQALIDLINDNRPYNLEYEIRPVTGPPFRIVRSTAEIARDENDKPLKVTGVIQDITREKEAEKELVRLVEQLKQSQKMESIGKLAGGIAHDFNNILTSILGFTELSLEDAQPGTPLQENLQEVHKSGCRARDLVRQILTFVQQVDGETKPIRIDLIAAEAVELFRSTLPATITLEQQIESESFVVGDPAQIHQIFLHLAANAAESMKDSGGVLTIGVKDVQKDSRILKELGLPSGGYVKITIGDSGIGISPEIIDLVFEPYFTTKKFSNLKGTGLGLSVVQGIVASYGGKITVDSEPGSGAVFSVYIPISRIAQEAQS